MDTVNVCVSVMTRYDLLRELLLSLRNSSVPPTAVYVFNAGRDVEQVKWACIDTLKVPIHIITPNRHTSLSEVMNWFIDNVPAERIMANDDIQFGKDTIELMLNTPGDVVGPRSGLGEYCTFSCFMLRDSAVEKVGYFDPQISPGYIYYEDCDYGARMIRAGATLVGIDCEITHGGSQTLAAKDTVQQLDHHRRFAIATQNYIRKWGGLPQHETYDVPQELPIPDGPPLVTTMEIYSGESVAPLVSP